MKFKTLALLAGLAVSALSFPTGFAEARGGFGGHGGFGHGGFSHGGFGHGGGYGRGFGRGGRGFGYGPAIGLGLGAAALGAYGAYNYARPYDYGYDCPGGRLVRDAYGQYFCD